MGAEIGWKILSELLTPLMHFWEEKAFLQKSWCQLKI
jgi:hypothetical protein